MLHTLIELAYLAAGVLFILGLKRLQSPATARGGNRMAALGMLVAVVATLFLQRILTPVEMLLGLVVGSGIGVLLARRVELTEMPELVAAFNGFGGIASTFVASAEIARYVSADASPTAAFDAVQGVTIGLSLLIGTVTFTGSFIAFGKLSGRISGNPVGFSGMRMLTALLGLGVIAGLGYLGWASGAFPDVSHPVVYAALGIACSAAILGVLLVLPIGGADMPVVVALLNAYSGLAAAATGFVLDNTALIISGALVGASGLILTRIMCEAMNRSLLNVLIGGFGGTTSASDDAGLETRTADSTTVDDAAILMGYADKVVVVPGYGMAVAQAQHQVRELADVLEARGVTVKYAIHPVAGRMPGHMNVLLAEANVPYDQLYDMDDINGDFDTTNVTLVIGANDVVNPAARTDASSPLYGMPILDVDRSKRVIVLKRSMRPGYSGVENGLFFAPNTQMLFGDAKASVEGLVRELKALA